MPTNLLCERQIALYSLTDELFGNRWNFFLCGHFLAVHIYTLWKDIYHLVMADMSILSNQNHWIIFLPLFNLIMPWTSLMKWNQAIVYVTATKTSHCQIDSPRSWTTLLTNHSSGTLIPLPYTEMRRWENSSVSVLKLITWFTKSGDDYCNSYNIKELYCNNEGCPSIFQRQSWKFYNWLVDLPLLTGTAPKHVWNFINNN